MTAFRVRECGTPITSFDGDGLRQLEAALTDQIGRRATGLLMPHLNTTNDLLSVMDSEMIAWGLSDKEVSKVGALVRFFRAMDLGRVEKPSEVSDPVIAARLTCDAIGYESRERVMVLLLDIKHRVIGQVLISAGSRSETVCPPDEIFGAVLRHGASRFIIAHNHPSGNLSPSPEDLSLTKALTKGAKILNLTMLDHMIVHHSQYNSLRTTHPGCF